jgi:hypothetical protein
MASISGPIRFYFFVKKKRERVKNWPKLRYVLYGRPLSSVNGINLSKPQIQYFQFKVIKVGQLIWLLTWN